MDNDNAVYINRPEAMCKCGHKRREHTSYLRCCVPRCGCDGYLYDPFKELSDFGEEAIDTSPEGGGSVRG